MISQILTDPELKALSNVEVLSHAKRLTEEERLLTAQILRLLREVERRRLYSELGFSSLHEFCVKFLQYSEGSAYRRISAMRLLRDLPTEEAKQIEASLNRGTLSLSSVSLTHSFFQSEKTKNHKIYSPQEKKEILTTLEGKSKREAERILMGISPHALPQEKERVLTPEFTQIQFVANSRLLEKLKRIEQLASHTLTRQGHSSQSYEVLLEYMADLVLEKIDPENKKNKTSKTSANATSPARHYRYVSRDIRKALWQRSNGQCEYVHHESGRRCEARSYLEVDHLKPLSQGGETELLNLRILCSSHNKTMASIQLGMRTLRAYLPSIN